MPLSSIAVFCGSSSGVDQRFTQAARQLGEFLANQQITLVYGGGSVGLMGITADAALAAGGRVIGVIPRAMVEAERGHRSLTEQHVVQTMHERKALMERISDGFIAMPGGFGTLDELFEIVTWAQLGFHRKPVGLLNIGGFYDELASFLDGVVKAGFIQPRFRAVMLMNADIPSLVTDMQQQTPVQGAGWIRP